MSTRRKILLVSALLGALTCLITGWAVSALIAPEGMHRTQAVVHAQRMEETSTDTARPYARSRRFIVSVNWGQGQDGKVADAEVSPFEYQRLHVGDTVQVFVDEGPPARVEMKLDAAYEVFLVLLGLLSLVASLALVAVGMRLETTGRDEGPASSI